MFWIFMFLILLIFMMQIPAYWLIVMAIRKDNPLLFDLAWIVAFVPFIPLICWAIAMKY